MEPRILIEDIGKSNIDQNGITENLLIHGDNLLTLKALEAKYASRVKCVYIGKDMNKIQLMEAAGISNSSMSRLHKGENLNTDTLIKIRDILGCDIEDVHEIVKEEAL